MPPLPISFDLEKTVNRIYRTTGGGVTWSSALSGASFDYFSDSPAVNDAIYFAYYLWNPYIGSGRWHNLKVYVGTARTNSGSGVWEYYDGSAWQTLTCTDPTNGFTVTGSNTITFDIPTDWTEKVDQSAGQYWIRYRLTDVSGITEGGANSTSSVACNDWSYHITGYSSSTPCTFADIKTYDSSNGINAVTNIEGNIYILDCSLIIGDGSTATYFKDTNKVIIMHGIIYTMAYGNFQLGNVGANGFPKDGCYLQMRDDANNRTFGFNGKQASAITKLYDTKQNFGTYTQQGATGCEYKSVQFSNVHAQVYGGLFDRVTFSDCWDGFRVSYTFSTAPNDIKVGSCASGIYVGFLSANYYDVYNMVFGEDISTRHFGIMSSNSNGLKFRLYDPVGYDTSKVSPRSDATDCWIAEYYTVSIRIVDKDNNPIENAHVILTNASSEILSGDSDSNGEVTLVPEVSRVLITNPTTIIDKNPVQITIRKDGFETYKCKHTLSAKCIFSVRLKSSVSPGLDEMGDEFKQ